MVNNNQEQPYLDLHCLSTTVCPHLLCLHLSRIVTKPTKWHVRPAKTGHPPSLIRVFAVRMKKAWVLSYPLSAQWGLWSDWAEARADLSSLAGHFVGFAMLRLIWVCCLDIGFRNISVVLLGFYCLSFVNAWYSDWLIWGCGNSLIIISLTLYAFLCILWNATTGTLCWIFINILPIIIYTVLISLYEAYLTLCAIV